MLKKIAIRNFLSIGQETVTLGFTNLNILVGPNAAGKSNLIDAINFFAEPMSASSTFSGERKALSFDKEEELFHNLDKTQQIGLQLEVDFCNEPINILPEINSGGLAQQSLEKEARSVSWTFAYQLKPYRLVQKIMINNKEYVAIKQEVKEGRFAQSPIHSYRMRIKDSVIITNPPAVKSEILKLQHENFKLTRDGLSPNKDFTERQMQLAYLVTDIASYVAEKFEKVLVNQFYYLSPVRGEVPFRDSTGGSPEYVGSKGEFLLQVLAKLQSMPDAKKKLNNINKWASKFHIKDITSGWVGNNELRGLYKESRGSISLPLHRTSYGTKQLLPFIIQIFACNKGDTVVIEEPEISLHPEAQINLAELLAEAVNQGIQIILTTHSEHLVLALEVPLKKKQLKEEEVNIYHITRSKKLSSTVAKKVDIIENGHVSNWISSFDDANKKLFSEYLTFDKKKKKNKKKR